MKIKVPNNPAQLGVEISDLNLSEEFSVDQIAEIRKSWTDYGVAIFPDQKLTHENFEKFSLLFGNFGDDPYLKSLDDRPNIVEVKEQQMKKLLLLGVIGIPIGPFKRLLPVPHYCIQK